MNTPTIILLTLIAAAFAASIRSIFKKHKNDCSNCNGCPYNSACMSDRKVSKERN